MLIERGISRGQKCAILLMNCLEWLPIYFGILKAGAIAVPLNFRFTAEEIDYCLKASDSDVLFYGPEFIGRIEDIASKLKNNMLLYFVGDPCPTYAEDYYRQSANASSIAPRVLVEDTDDAAIYFSSGTTGFPKAILLDHTALMQSARMEAAHHETKKNDCFLCIPPLYHTGAKMHWFGSLYTGSRAVILKGNSPEAIFQAVSNEGCTIVWLLVPWAQDILAALDPGKAEIEELPPEPVAAHAHRRAAGAAEPDPALDGVLPEPQVRHQLRPLRVHRPRLRAPGHGERPQGRRHRRPRLRLEGKIVDENDQAVKQGEVGELCVKGPGVMVEYYQEPGGHRGGPEERLAPHRRHGPTGRGRLHLPGGPQEGRHHLRR